MTAPLREARVLVIEDHALFAESVILALRLAGFNVRQLPLDEPGGPVAAAVRARPSIALVDLDLGGYGDGTELIEPLCGTGAAVIVVTASSDRVQWGECLHRGAVAVLSKNAPLDGLLAAVRQQEAGLPAMPRSVRESLLELWRRDGKEKQELRHRFAKLTPRERQVLGGLVSGHMVHEIAVADMVAEATVRTQVKAILSKLEVNSQLTAVALAHEIGWHPAEPRLPRAV
jgi:DNA-binding NarL/FixJ family response regulator